MRVLGIWAEGDLSWMTGSWRTEGLDDWRSGLFAGCRLLMSPAFQKGFLLFRPSPSSCQRGGGGEAPLPPRTHLPLSFQCDASRPPPEPQDQSEHRPRKTMSISRESVVYSRARIGLATSSFKSKTHG